MTKLVKSRSYLNNIDIIYFIKIGKNDILIYSAFVGVNLYHTGYIKLT